MNNLTPEQHARALEIVQAWDHAHTCRPVWRPTTAEEIQPGWEVRSRDHLGAEATWGVAHLQTDEGGWLTESGSLLSCRGDGWAYETTAPLPEPKPGDMSKITIHDYSIPEVTFEEAYTIARNIFRMISPDFVEKVLLILEDDRAHVADLQDVPRLVAALRGVLRQADALDELAASPIGASYAGALRLGARGIRHAITKALGAES